MEFKRGVKQKYSAWVDNDALRSHELLNKNLSFRSRISPYKFLVRKGLEAPKPHRLLEFLLVTHQH